MFTAQEKRKTNIAEYLIYMFQVEDIIRSMDFDIDRIEKNVIAHYKLPYHDKRSLREWYSSLIYLLKSGKLEKSGHHPLLKNIMEEMNDLHTRLLSDPAEKEYGILYKDATPAINDLKRKTPGNGKHEIEICLDGLYGLLLLRLSKKQISPETEKAFRFISKMLAYLSAKFKLIDKGIS